MEDQAGQVMPAWFQPEKLHIKLVRMPCQRMPIAGVTGAECPFHILPVQPTQYVGVIRDVIAVVKVYETAVKHRPISGQRHGTQKRTNENGASVVDPQLSLRRRWQ